MNRPEQSATQVDLSDALMAAGVGLGPIRPQTRLIRQTPDAAARVLEFYSIMVSGRLLAMHRDSNEGHIHEVLRDHNLPVFTDYNEGPEDFRFLQVPIGTRPLSARLHLFGRDIRGYGTLLTDIVASQRKQSELGLGTFVSSEDSSLLDHFAFTPDANSERGQQMYLVPPYDVDFAGTAGEFAHTLAQELAATELFNEAQTAVLHQAIERGLHGDAAS